MDKIYKELLDKHNLKYSKNRILILKILDENIIPISVEYIYEICRKRGSSINISTIYRVLKTFGNSGIVTRTALEIENKSLYELNRHDHKHHLMCLGCNTIIYISGCPLDSYQRELEDKFKYNILSHRLEMYGYCDKCKGKRE